MGLKGLAVIAVMFAITQAPVAIASAIPQIGRDSASFVAYVQVPVSPTQGGQSGGISQPRISVTNPAPAPSAWTMHEQIAWAANVVLAFVGYAGVWLAYNLLKKIERQTSYGEAAAEAATTCAQAALLSAQAVIHAERPWILITVEPSRSLENSFTVMATNRGRTPARIIDSADEAMIAADQRILPTIPEYGTPQPAAPFTPIILVPGESTPIKPFSRDEVRGICDSDERFRRIETWEEKVFLYGKVTYLDLISPANSQTHETNWCCWYIHGRQNSGMVIAGPIEYNSHT
ncbi:MAG: hypothetical protein ABSF70_13445 [Terracidiphilus sp.]|jgi:hypothetical protein